MNFLHFQLQLKREKKKSGQSSKKTKKKSFMRSKKKGEISQDETLDKTLNEMQVDKISDLDEVDNDM